MLTAPVHFPDHTGGLEPAAFHAQLRRLESLQTLMAQGGAVVGEVAQFLTKVREELSAFQREQEIYATVQRQLVEEKTELAANLAAVVLTVENTSLQVKEYKLRVDQLTAQLAGQKDDTARVELEAAREQAAQERAAAAEKIVLLETALERERGGRDKAVVKVRENQALLYANEIAFLKQRLSALEEQLDGERERRARLMEVVKVHDVTVNAQKQNHPV